jgi:hypothetical protein
MKLWKVVFIEVEGLHAYGFSVIMTEVCLAIGLEVRIDKVWALRHGVFENRSKSSGNKFTRRNHKVPQNFVPNFVLTSLLLALLRPSNMRGGSNRKAR